VEGSCKHGNENSGSRKCWEILEWLSDWWLLKKDSAPWSLLVSSLIPYTGVSALKSHFMTWFSSKNNAELLQDTCLYSGFIVLVDREGQSTGFLPPLSKI
jgi:hypothetical protein